MRINKNSNSDTREERNKLQILHSNISKQILTIYKS